MSDVTQLLNAVEKGDPRASEELLPLVYEELRKLAAARMAQQPEGQTLQATALVRPLSVNSRFRVLWETNRYSVPAHWAGTNLTARIYADRLALYHQGESTPETSRRKSST